MSLKSDLFAWAKRLGLLAQVRDSAWRRERLLILCYHGISIDDEHEWNPSLYMSPEVFRGRLERLRADGYTVLSLGEGLARLQAGTLPSRAVALTFDDGAVDFTEQALPLLQEFEAPATVYVTTYYSDHRLPVFDTALSYVLWRGRRSDADVAPLIGAAAGSLRATPVGWHAAWSALYEYARRERLDAIAKDALLRAVATAVGADYDALVRRRLLHIMTPDEVCALPRPLVDVQLHTHRHRTPRDRTLFVREILDNRARLAELGSAPEALRHFCYPSGDYAGEFLPWLSELGVASATTCVPGLATRTSPSLLLPRFVDTNAQSGVTFEAWISGVAALLPQRREYRLDSTRLRRRIAHAT